MSRTASSTPRVRPGVAVIEVIVRMPDKTRFKLQQEVGVDQARSFWRDISRPKERR